MAKKSFWKRGEDYAKKVSGELIEQSSGEWRPGKSPGSRGSRPPRKTVLSS